jgi:small subunit ribosomal protein S21
VQILVRDNNVDQALRALKKKMQREGLLPAKPKPTR